MAKKRGSGEGSIYRRRDGRWCATATVSMPGQRRRRRSFYGATRQEVATQLTGALRNRDQGLRDNPERRTVAQLINSWLQEVKGARRRSTYESYESLCRVQIIPEIGQVRLAQLEPDHITGLMTAKIESGLAPQTVRHIRTVMRRALNRAIKWKWVSWNVAAVVEPPTMQRKEVVPLTPEECRDFLAAARNRPLEALYVIALASGMRQGEVLGLRWSDLRLEEGERPSLRVSQALQRGGGEFRFDQPKTERSKRTLSLAPSVVKALVAHRARQAAQRLALGPAWLADLDLVFTAADGSPIERKSLHRDFKQVLQAAGLPASFKFHGLRHSTASLLIAQGASTRVIMGQLGHNQIGTTMDIYGHLMPEALREAADKIEAILGNAKG